MMPTTGIAISQRRTTVCPVKKTSRTIPIVARIYTTSRISVPIVPAWANSVNGSPPQNEPGEGDDDVGGQHHGAGRCHRSAPTGRDLAEPAVQDAVPAHREDEPGGADRAGQGTAEGRDHRPGRDDVADPGGDVGGAEVADQRGRGDEGLDARCRGPEAHHLHGGHHEEVNPAEDRVTAGGSTKMSA